ncbi:MAG: helix-turn-helix transcriptional regulator [Gemmatimonadaceae bacterium]
MSFQTRRDIVQRAHRAHDARRGSRSHRAGPSSRKSLGERLCDWREANDLSQSEAAIRLKISKRTLQEWEQGRAEPRHLAMEAIAALISR